MTDAMTPPALRPFDAAALDDLARSLAPARVVGVGESTRFSRETFEIRDRLFRALVERHGFRVLAVQDAAGAAARQDRYVRAGEGSAESALDDAWRPWRTTEMAAALEWVRGFNREHPGDPVRIIGVKPVQARAADYDAVLDAVRAHAPERSAEVAGHLDVIRSAHTVDEHVQRARGRHPGRPFAEHAREALALVGALPEETRARMRLIVEFHENSVAGRGGFAGDDEVGAASIIEHERRTGARVVYWDGITHTSASPVASGPALGGGTQPTAGSVLRGHYGQGYASVAVGFGRGHLGVVDVPAPAADLLDAALSEAGPPVGWADLRDGGPSGPAKLRVISGVYDPARDADAHMRVDSLSGAFDVLVHVRDASAVTWLP